ncbi:uncharacterized protein LOC112562344 isoform X1 [Pomacea canaliculata]|uniref:uncharacterized protein LOC112562344 isoform X1 n=1 Tax=Pomacea canaliculata TaxID=400727 RepID=UPI000D72962E|nr:uncharacterized protein LOC112562344 isoform X1 [Pomacea canaliculata]XP_025091351.1 uncharacterized protein LOC112562344 isoform X1 [Pomacea canaliculata]
MPLWIYCCVVLFVHANAQTNERRRQWIDEPQKGPWSETYNSLIDIDVYNPVAQDEYEEASGSGSGGGGLVTDDEDLLLSGSGSGTDMSTSTTTTMTTTTTTSLAPRTPCEQLREASKHLLGNYVPRCTVDGDYDSLQCRGHPGTGTCWCADLGGREIPGTAHQAHTPDCIQGTNLPPCVFKLVQHSRSGLLGTFRPRCSLDGNFEPKQCVGSMCFCVNINDGVKRPGTEVYLPDDPVCDRKDDQRTTLGVQMVTDFKVTPTTLRTSTVKDSSSGRKIDVNIGTEKPREEKTTTPTSNDTGNKEPVKEPSSAAHVMTQPGILAAIIGGAVVLLLCAILLVMFVVYRMRKKDEGSYALEEPKKLPYSYQRAPDKEFYA